MENIWELIVIAMVIGYIFVISYQTHVIQKRTDKKIDELLRHFELGLTFIENKDEILNNYLIEGRKNKAIRRYRELTNCSLLDASEYVEEKLKKHINDDGSKNNR